MFAKLCATSHVHELTGLHRFTEPWEAAAASQRLRAGDPTVLDLYEAHGRITAGAFDDHLARVATQWLAVTAAGRLIAITASTTPTWTRSTPPCRTRVSTPVTLTPTRAVLIAAGECAHVEDVIVTRRNDRRLFTTHVSWSATVTGGPSPRLFTDGALPCPP